MVQLRFEICEKIVAGGEGFFIYFHYLDDQNNGVIYVGDNGRTTSNIGFFSGGNEVGEGKEIKVRTLPDRWYKVRMEIRGTKVGMYVDDKQWFQCDSGPVRKGRIALATWKTAVRFMDMIVTTPDDKPLWIGPPIDIAVPGRSAQAPAAKRFSAPADDRGGEQSARPQAVAAVRSPSRTAGRIRVMAGRSARTDPGFQGREGDVDRAVRRPRLDRL